MRRAVGIPLCVFLLLGCSNKGYLYSEAAVAPSPDEVDPAAATPPSENGLQGAAPGTSEEGAGPKSSPPFPLEAFEKAFQRLAEEMKLPTDEGLSYYKNALETLFKTTPEAFKEEKSTRSSPRGLLKKMLAAKMERGAGSLTFNPEEFAVEFSKAFKLLKNFEPDKGASPAQALERLAQLTQTSISPEGANTMQQYLVQTAKMLREVLPFFPSSDDDEEL